ncbi:hypothetical protein DXX93_02195 [Thalassotalea euphylliae]|uniref:PepSY domain-containing protein n=2 Tax=Thalassotalea euphylliae TaxID=1655234 RepID=A0A3E0TN81_9GAMM|nr:hypothetical protein DXX93_02195 [Thalassotalea euphylliae]
MRLSVVFIVAAISIQPLFAHAASSIAGIWQHAHKPALIEFDLDTGVGCVKAHRSHPKNQGQTVIRKITKATKPDNLWLGEMYHAERGIFVPVSIKKEKRRVFVYDAHGNQILALKRGD